MNFNEVISPEYFCNCLAKYEHTTLKLLNKQDLLNRYDTKYAVDYSSLPYLLESLAPHYKILENNGLRCFDYFNLYFDTNNYLTYTHHHNGKLNRFKIRYREYSDSQLCFFEIKQRQNDSRTIKKRIIVDSIQQAINGEAANMVSRELGLDPAELHPKLTSKYKRITLINPEIQEKITIDLNLNFKNTINSFAFKNVAMLEIKQQRINHLTFSNQLLREMTYRPVQALSKYCVGMVMTQSIKKYNHFKPTIIQLEKIMRQEYELGFFK